MGRSVDYLNRATKVAYADVSYFGMSPPWDEEAEDFDYIAEPVYCEHTAEDDWDSFKERLAEGFAKYYPSLDLDFKSRNWDGETQIIASNKLVEVGLSEYCGLLSLSVRPLDEHPWLNYSQSPIGERFARQVNLDKVLAHALGEEAVLRKVGTFSNGESVYRSVAA
jgi:hypothetical protein